MTCQNLLRKETENAQGNCLVEIDGVSTSHKQESNIVVYTYICSFNKLDFFSMKFFFSIQAFLRFLMAILTEHIILNSGSPHLTQQQLF